MTERRETGRKPLSVRKDAEPDWSKGERIAKWLASAGVCSRRDAEKLIEQGLVTVDGKVLDSPAFKVTGREAITVDGRKVARPDKTRLWRYHKPKGLVTTNFDPEGRPTVFEALPKQLPRVITVGRLDLNTEGLLLLTNDGELARLLELPSTGLERKYRARAYGEITQRELDTLRDGITFEGIEYKSIKAVLTRTTGGNNWIDMTLTEGKKREARRALESVGLRVNRLIRVSYGPFELGDLPEGQAAEVPPAELLAEFGEKLSRRRRPDPSRAAQDIRPVAPASAAKKKKPAKPIAGAGWSKPGRVITEAGDSGKGGGPKRGLAKPGSGGKPRGAAPKGVRPPGKRPGPRSGPRGGA